MRYRWLGALTVLLLPATLVAGPKKSKVPKVDISAVKDELIVLHDGSGHYIVTSVQKKDDNIFYGNGRTFHRVRHGVQRGYRESEVKEGKPYTRDLWDPRTVQEAKGYDWHRAQLKLHQKKWTIRCEERITPLAVVGAAEAKKMIDKARFFEPSWTRQPVSLSRDDMGNYYYVDRLTKQYGKGFRLFRGPQGAMVEQRLVNALEDSKGNLFVSKAGVLKIVAVMRNRFERREAKEWITKKGKERISLTDVPIPDNDRLIYIELGIYEGRFGTPCDDI